MPRRPRRANVVQRLISRAAAKVQRRVTRTPRRGPAISVRWAFARQFRWLAEAKRSVR